MPEITESHPFYKDDVFLSGEQNLLGMSVFRADRLGNSNAKRHIKRGFDFRLLMIQSSRIFLRENTRRADQRPLDPYLASEISVHLNSYYLNVCGAFDNLAWSLTYECSLLSGANEEQGRSRRFCNLFGDAFIASLVTSGHDDLARLLQSQRDWGRELKEIRDPAAHRISLYAAPGVVRDTETLAEFRRIESQASLRREDLVGRSRSSYLNEPRLLARYYPLMVLQLPSGAEQIGGIPGQVGRDHGIFLEVTTAVLAELLPDQGTEEVRETWPE